MENNELHVLRIYSIIVGGVYVVDATVSSTGSKTNPSTNGNGNETDTKHSEKLDGLHCTHTNSHAFLYLCGNCFAFSQSSCALVDNSLERNVTIGRLRAR